jgi:tetratricopeptide (TPR) repeat protein
VLATDVLDIVSRLVDKSLVTVVRREGVTRYGLLQTLVDYGGARLVAAGEEEVIRDRHLAWVVALATEAGSALRGPRQMTCAAGVAAERANVIAALQRARTRPRADDGLAIVGGLAYGWYINGTLLEGYAAMADALAHPGEASAEHRAYALAWLAWIGQHGASTTEVATAQLAEAVELARDASSHVFCTAAVFSSRLLTDQGRIDAAAALLDEADAVLAAAPDRWARALVDWARAGLAVHNGDLDMATALLRRSIAGYEAEGDELGKAFGTPRLGELAELRGDYEEAVAATESAYATVSAVGATGFQASRLAVRLGNLASLQGDHDAADRWHTGALTNAREGGFLRAVAEALAGQGDAAARQGRLHEAEELQREALEEYRAMRSVVGQASTLAALGGLAVARGDLDAAEALYRESLEHASTSDDRRAMALAAEGLEQVAVARG